MKGWFDAFRDDGGPTLYAYSNRTSVTGDVSTIVIILTFLTIYLAFVIIFPGVRREKFSTFCTITLSLLTGLTLCLCNFGTHWEVASSNIVSSYRAFSSQQIYAKLGVSIGLDHANITLRQIPVDNRTLDINYNEKFSWIQPTDMKAHYIAALAKGLPYPILSAAEYLTIDKEGFHWGRHYRNAGYYTSIILWSAFASWILSNLLLLTVPRYGGYTMMLTGLFMGGASLCFWGLKPPSPLEIQFEDVILTFKLGWCFWMNLFVGILVGCSGFTISVVDWVYPHKFSTFIEVDFDTPYDRHIIIEDSIETRKRRFKIPILDEPLNSGVLHAGASLLRRLSKRNPRKEQLPEVETNPGLDNPVFDMSSLSSQEPKLFPWKSSLMLRSDSKRSNKSIKSVNFRGSLKSQEFLEIPDTPKIGDNVINKPVLNTKLFVRADSKLTTHSDPPENIMGDLEPEVSVLPDIPEPSISRQNSTASSTSISSYGGAIMARDPSIKRLMDQHNGHAPVARNNSGNIIVFHRTDSRGQLQRLSGEVVEIQTED